LRLKVNEAKSAVAQPEERKFLGFSISNDGSERHIAPKSFVKFKAQIRDMTRRTRGISLPQLVKELTPYLLGWRGYFGFCQTPRVLTNLEGWRCQASPYHDQSVADFIPESVADFARNTHTFIRSTGTAQTPTAETVSLIARSVELTPGRLFEREGEQSRARSGRCIPHRAR